MATEISATSWVYALIQNPGGNEQIVGQHDAENDISFIPTFLSKDAATQGMMQMTTEKGYKYEIQAIIFEDLEKFAAAGGFVLFIVDEDGKLMEKIVPATTTKS